MGGNIARHGRSRFLAMGLSQTHPNGTPHGLRSVERLRGGSLLQCLHHFVVTNRTSYTTVYTDNAMNSAAAFAWGWVGSEFFSFAGRSARLHDLLQQCLVDVHRHTYTMHLFIQFVCIAPVNPPGPEPGSPVGPRRHAV